MRTSRAGCSACSAPLRPAARPATCPARTDEFPGARGAFAGASVGVLAALFAVAVTFVEHTTPLAESGFARRVRPVLVVVVPVCVIAPVAFLLCLAIRR